ncbi:tetratricopeptide repeat protein [Treponema brennaborense]|uniref:Uncharacterized protein n=1 Tax=Treponema brennaborense (strain DSM 12168 / CIP 105900 / DD5/3) TaxID=906968 RepID=F4LQE0_TREBD|nr:hypothetical protein [Treponema brennaborense]AEE17149.1 hypothetical protein Trebr_1727 [Treponema brennaborense DSM 12168]
MASHGVLHRARTLLKRRQFSDVIKLLKGCELEYRDSFEYYYILAIACMYVGDTGGAGTYLQAARKIKLLDTRLLVAQAALFLRRGDTGRAVEYYLEVLDNEPANKIAPKALDFIRKHGDPDTISEWVSSGKIKRFYPPLGVPPAVSAWLTVCAVCVLCAAAAVAVYVRREALKPPARADLSAFALTVEDRAHILEDDLSGGVYRYILTPKQIAESYDSVRLYFQDYRDNAAQVEINRILNSNASALVRQNAQMLKSYLREPGFDTVSDNYPYGQVASDPYLYADCWVVWSGRVTNVYATDTSYQCDLLVGYENQKRVDGIVPLVFAEPMDIDAARPLRVLGRIRLRDGKLTMDGKSVYQPVDGNKL